MTLWVRVRSITLGTELDGDVAVDHGTQMPAHLGIEPDESQLADQKLQTRIRCHALGTELDGDIAVDTALNICFHSSHST